MRFTLLAVILAAFLAAPLAAADRPVGPETGQARVGEDNGLGYEPELNSDFVPWGGRPPVLWAHSASDQETNLTATEWWNHFVRMFRCGITMCY